MNLNQFWIQIHGKLRFPYEKYLAGCEINCQKTNSWIFIRAKKELPKAIKKARNIFRAFFIAFGSKGGIWTPDTAGMNRMLWPTELPCHKITVAFPQRRNVSTKITARWQVFFCTFLPVTTSRPPPQPPLASSRSECTTDNHHVEDRDKRTFLCALQPPSWRWSEERIIKFRFSICGLTTDGAP